jgi:hypothetical protein
MSPKKMIGLLCACGRKLCEAFLISRDRRRLRFCIFLFFSLFQGRQGCMAEVFGPEALAFLLRKARETLCIVTVFCRFAC